MEEKANATWQVSRVPVAQRRTSGGGLGDTLDMKDEISVGLGCGKCGKPVQQGQEHSCNGESKE